MDLIPLGLVCPDCSRISLGFQSPAREAACRYASRIRSKAQRVLFGGTGALSTVKDEPTHVDLFSGIGGFALAARWAGFKTRVFVEIDKYCQKVLAKNFLPEPDAIGRNGRTYNEGEAPPERAWPSISGDIFDFDGTAYRGCSLLTGGFPCQPFSVAGKRRGAEDDRHLWPEMLRVINEAKPTWVLGENVPGIIPMELDNVLSDLEDIGYATRPFVIPACAVDAKHRRDRLWIIGRLLADAGGDGLSKNETMGIDSAPTELPSFNDIDGLNPCVSDNEGERFQGERKAGRQGASEHGVEALPLRHRSVGRMWITEPDVGRVAHGIPSRVDRLKGLGNAIVPQVAYEILREIRKLI